jgi:phosphatidyl-myo-inositol alpha-mannosyltransferase
VGLLDPWAGNRAGFDDMLDGRGETRMRLGIVSPYSWTVPGGVNNHIIDLVSHLEERGHETWVIAPCGSRRHSSVPFPTNFISAGRAFPVKSNGSVAWVNIWPFMLQKMDRILRAHDFDLVHVHEPSIPSVGAAATMRAKVPVVGTFHAAGYAVNHYASWMPMATRIMRSLTVGMVVSEAARECVSTHFPGDYRVVNNGINLSTYLPARSGDKVPGRILFVGRAEPRKGLPVLLEAYRHVRRRLPNASLALAGVTKPEVVALLARSGIKKADGLDGIIPLGYISEEDKLEQMRQAEVMCAPSLGGESFGLVLVEALAGGVPVVASDIPGYRAVLRGGEAGVLVRPNDPGVLEDVLVELLQDGPVRATLATRGMALAEEYSWERIVTEVLAVYEHALAVGPQVVREGQVPLFSQFFYALRARISGTSARRKHNAGRKVGAAEAQGASGRANGRRNRPEPKESGELL